MADQESNHEGRALSAPYTAFSSIKTALRQMKEHGIPARIDRSVLTNFSGAVASQVMTAFKFLELTDDDGRPLQAMTSLVAACDDENAWPNALEPVIRQAYAPMFAFNLETLSPSQFNENFKASFPGADAVVRKSITFFLNAVREARIPVSAYITKNKKPRTAPTRRRSRQQRGTGSGTETAPPAYTPPATVLQNKPMEYRLLDLLSPQMSEAQREAVWTLISYLKQPKGAA